MGARLNGLKEDAPFAIGEGQYGAATVCGVPNRVGGSAEGYFDAVGTLC